MRLEKFDYHYTATGDKGGLESVGFAFLPFDPYWTTSKWKSITLDNFKRLRGVCDDILLGKPFKCESKPDFSDSPRASRGGYVYEGSTGGALSPNNQFLYAAAHFTLGKMQLDEGSNWDRALAASYMMSDEKTILDNAASLGKISIDATFRLTHDGNIAIMNALLALPNVDICPGAKKSINDLRKLLDHAGDANAKMTDFLELEADGG